MTFQVREASQKDTEGIVTIWRRFMELLRRTNQHYWKVADPKAFSKFISRAYAKDQVLVVVAENVQNELVGFTLAQIEILPEWFGSQKLGMIRYQAVSEDYQGRGVGRAMTDFVIDWYRSLGIVRVELNVLSGLSSSKYWSRIGFKEFMHRRFIEM